MHELIENLQRKQWLWQGNQQQSQPDVLPSGYPELDEKLNGGLPKVGLIEIQAQPGIGELRLLKPYLQQASSARLNVFIAPPGQLCAEFFSAQGFNIENILIIRPKQEKEALWAAEQCAKSGACAHVILWQQKLNIQQAKRLQLACDQGQCSQIIFKRPMANSFPLPVSLSMRLEAHPQGLICQITKRKGGWPQGKFVIDFTEQWSALAQASQPNTVVPFPLRKRG
ncbi:translesion DNA synthesis-associated protein ImuA [Vibrio sp. SCSIO 43136]|uniref:translesion DNA synthesis-associated protein ImuA n=1 Tax=Vibrio sp. SCSIO 43136 TaxID=2819101 RepID=UPI0020765503|nr:translesion DNA synthesis-associated protein ImuA [Vibrio sp. SCSIO 43136]USD66180.1 translesion DNA synthesis-associated protein ImuA [Vibrio sp. SCSIO 43136]